MGEEPRNAPLFQADILLALNNGAVKKYRERVREDGVVVAHTETEGDGIAIPFEDIAQEETGGKIYANTVAVGALVAMLGMDFEPLKQVLKRMFSDKGKAVAGRQFQGSKEGF